MSALKMKLTDARRARIGVILSALGAGVGIAVKARLVARQLGEPCEYGEALSLLSQFKRPKVRRGKSWAQVNEERFQRQKARRPDLYR